MMAAIVAPAGVRSIARMRACLVSGRVEVFGGECADCERGLDLLVVLLAERAAALDLDFVMGSSEVMRRHPPHHLSPAGAKPRQGKTAKRAFASSKSSQQRSDRIRKPVKSEQDSCSFDGNHALHAVGPNCNSRWGGAASFGPSGAERLALSGDPVDQTCSIHQRCCLVLFTAIIAVVRQKLHLSTCSNLRSRLCEPTAWIVQRFCRLR
jgi:hypothetical protein